MRFSKSELNKTPYPSKRASLSSLNPLPIHDAQPCIFQGNAYFPKGSNRLIELCHVRSLAALQPYSDLIADVCRFRLHVHLDRGFRRTARSLFDNGSQADFISTQFCRKMGINTQALDTPFPVRLPNGTTIQVSQVARVTVAHGPDKTGYKADLQLYVLDLQGWDIILGQPWAKRHDVVWHAKDNSVRFHHRCRQISIEADSMPESQRPLKNLSAIDLVSRKQIMKDSKQGAELYCVYVSLEPDSGEIFLHSLSSDPSQVEQAKQDLGKPQSDDADTQDPFSRIHEAMECRKQQDPV